VVTVTSTAPTVLCAGLVTVIEESRSTNGFAASHRAEVHRRGTEEPGTGDAHGVPARAVRSRD
jgi:hypothetical protein